MKISIALTISFVVLLSEFISNVNCLPGFQKFSLGDFNGTVLTDGSYTLCSNPYQISEKRYIRTFQSARRQINPARIGVNVVVVDIQGKRIMVDTGSYLPPSIQDPSSENAGVLLESMKLAEISPESIDAVIITHGHIDHVSGLTAPDGTAAFKNAKVYISKTEHEFWTNPKKYSNSDLGSELGELLAQIYQNAISKYSGKLRLISNKYPMKGVNTMVVPGHTPGHLVIKFMGEKSLFVTGDSFVGQAFQLKTPSIRFLFDTNRSQAVQSRHKLFSLLATSRDLVLSYHEPFPGLGYVDKTKKSYRWIEASYEDIQPDSTAKCM